MEQWQTEILTAIRDGYVPSFSGSIDQWAETYCDIQGSYTIKGPFDCSRSPHFKKVFQFIQDPLVREVNLIAPTRSGKTLIFEIGLLYTIATNSGDILWLTLSDEKAEQTTEKRISKLLEHCEPVKHLLSDDKYNIQTRKYKFQHLDVDVTSPKDNALNILGFKTIFNDEVWRYGEVYGNNIIDTIKHRIDEEYKDVSKVYCFSQSGMKGEAWHNQYVLGEQWEYGWRCPQCNTLQTCVFKGKRQDGSKYGIVFPEIRDEQGKYKINECANNAKMVCEHCNLMIQDTLVNRYNLLNGGDYIKVCDGQNNKVKSLKMSFISNPKTSWGDLVILFLNALRLQEVNRDDTLLQNFVTKNLAEWWDTYKPNNRTIIKLSQYDPSNPFGEFEGRIGDTPCRFMAIDCQQKEPYFYYGIISVNSIGDIRVIKFGKCNSWDELNVIRINNKVEERCVGVDTGDGPNQESLRSKCVSYGKWIEFDDETLWGCYLSLKGSGQREFRKHKDGKFYRYAEPEEHYVVSSGEDEGKFLTHVTWSNPKYKQILEALRDGKAERKLEFNEVSDELTEQLNSEYYGTDPKTGKQSYIQKTGVPNHYWDVFNMCLVLMDLFGCLMVNNNEPSIIVPNEDEAIEDAATV